MSWGEFVETSLLAGYRSRGVSLQRLRPAVQRLRQDLGAAYPLATTAPYLDVAGRELVRRVQDETGVDRALHLVVVRSGQPVVRSVPTAVLAEGFRAGTGVTELAGLYDLRSEQVLQAIRSEMRTAQSRSVA